MNPSGTQNLVNDKRGFETRLNGGHPIGLLFSLKESLKGSLKGRARESIYINYLSMDSQDKSLRTAHTARTASLSLRDRDEQTKDNPVPKRIQPRQFPGIYMILCLANNKRYYGQTTNVSARLSGHRSRLRRNVHEVIELQRDFNLYGEESFEFTTLYIARNLRKEELTSMEVELIGRYTTLCYNKFEKINRQKENNPFYGKEHTQAARDQISKSLAERRDNHSGFAILLHSQPYPSISEASRQTTHSRDTIRRWLRNPNDLRCVAVSQSLPLGDTKDDDLSFRNMGISKPVSLYAETYPSIAEAARQRKCSRSNIQRLLRSHPDQCFFIEDKSVP